MFDRFIRAKGAEWVGLGELRGDTLIAVRITYRKEGDWLEPTGFEVVKNGREVHLRPQLASQSAIFRIPACPHFGDHFLLGCLSKGLEVIGDLEALIVIDGR
jgi:hypothetical protein